MGRYRIQDIICNLDGSPSPLITLQKFDQTPSYGVFSSDAVTIETKAGVVVMLHKARGGLCKWDGPRLGPSECLRIPMPLVPPLFIVHPTVPDFIKHQ